MTKIRAIKLAGLVLALVITACGDQGASKSTRPVSEVTMAPADTTIATNTTEPSPTTTAETTQTTTPAVNLAQECVDAIHAYVQDIEPALSSIDFASASVDEYDQLELDLQPSLLALVNRWIAADCPEIADVFPPELENDLLDFAEREAPGSLYYLELNYAEVRFEGGDDCDSRFNALKGYVDQGGVFADLSAADKANVFSLYSQMRSRCGLQPDEVLDVFLQIGQ